MAKATSKKYVKSKKQQQIDKTTSTQQAVREALMRRSPADLILLGDIVERSYFNTGFNEILHALTQGRIMKEATENKNGTPSDRILGRIEMAAMITQELEQFIIDRDNLRKPVRQEESQDFSTIAHEPEMPDNSNPYRYGGQV